MAGICGGGRCEPDGVMCGIFSVYVCTYLSTTL